MRITIGDIVRAHSPLSDLCKTSRRAPVAWTARGITGALVYIAAGSGMLEVSVYEGEELVDFASDIAYTSSADGAGDMETEEMLALSGFDAV